MDPIDTGNPVRKELSKKICEVAAEIDSGITVHDFRMVPGPTHTNLIFDVVLPASLYPRRNEIETKIEEAVKEMDENYFAVIKSEISYC